MPHHFVSRPVANSLQSGTFKTGGGVKKLANGGKAKRYADGDSVVDDPQTQANKKAYEDWYKNQGEENESDRKMIPNAIKSGYEAIKNLFGSKEPEGSVTKTEKSVTVAPPKRRGGSMKR